MFQTFIRSNSITSHASAAIHTRLHIDIDSTSSGSAGGLIDAIIQDIDEVVTITVTTVCGCQPTKGSVQ